MQEIKYLKNSLTSSHLSKNHIKIQHDYRSVPLTDLQNCTQHWSNTPQDVKRNSDHIINGITKSHS